MGNLRNSMFAFADDTYLVEHQQRYAMVNNLKTPKVFPSACLLDPDTMIITAPEAINIYAISAMFDVWAWVVGRTYISRLTAPGPVGAVGVVPTR